MALVNGSLSRPGRKLEISQITTQQKLDPFLCSRELRCHTQDLTGPIQISLTWLKSDTTKKLILLQGLHGIVICK